MASPLPVRPRLAATDPMSEPAQPAPPHESAPGVSAASEAAAPALAQLWALLRADANLRLCLQHTGYFETAHRACVLEMMRRLKACDEERDRLVLDIRAATDGAAQALAALPCSPPPSLSLGAAAAAAESSVAASVHSNCGSRCEERAAGTGDEEGLVPAPRAEAGLSSRSRARGRADTRFFLVKYFDSVNIYLSQRDGLWTTQAKNGPVLAQAFEECQSVILFFSINKSLAFQGFARMKSAPDAALRKPEWIRNINLAAVTEPFGVEWICTATTDFDGVGDLKNPLNECHSVIGRDGQEYPPDCGRRMMALLSRPPAAAAADPPCRPAVAAASSRHTRDASPLRPPTALSTAPVPAANCLNLIDC